MSHERDSGDWGGNPRVDFVWGNMPMQPLDDRQYIYNQENGGTVLSAGVLYGGDNHDIVLDEWNAFPANEPNVGRTLVDGGNTPSFIWPSLGPCGGSYDFTDSSLATVLTTLKACGVDPMFLKDFTFTGGSNTGDKWDWYDATPNYDGSIFWSYIDPTQYIGTTAEGTPIFGSDLNNYVIYANYGAGFVTPLSTDPGDWWRYAIVVLQSENPNKNTAAWWD